MAHNFWFCLFNVFECKRICSGLMAIALRSNSSGLSHVCGFYALKQSDLTQSRKRAGQQYHSGATPKSSTRFHWEGETPWTISREFQLVKIHPLLIYNGSSSKGCHSQKLKQNDPKSVYTRPSKFQSIDCHFIFLLVSRMNSKSSGSRLENRD
jgi:hypothetical protein